MDRRLSIHPRDGHLSFDPELATAGEISADRLVGPMTRSKLIALIWRAKKLKIVAEVAATAEKEVYNEETEEFETETNSFTRSVDKVVEIIFPESEAAEAGDPVDDSRLVNHLLSRQDPFIVWARPFFELTAYFVLTSPYFEAPKKDASAGIWLEISPTAMFGSGINQTVWARRTESAVMPPGEMDFTGTLSILGASIDLPMRVTPLSDTDGDVVSIESASFAVTVEEWRTYATTSGSSAWNTTTGAPANGGPGA